MSKILHDIKDLIATAREKAYFSQHGDALNNFEQALELTKKQMKLINDQLLLAEWKKMETDIQAECDIVI